MFVVSARSRVELFDRPTIFINSFYLQNYIKPLSDPVFQRYLINSLIIATSNAVLVTILALLATYALSRWRLAGFRQHLLLDDHQAHGAAGRLHAAALPALHRRLQDRQLDIV